MTCKHCGANQVDTKEFECGTKTYCHIRGEECYESEIEKLREKKAEGLAWVKNGSCFFAESAAGKFIIMPESWNKVYCVMQDGKTCSRQPTVKLAKAHAEELHQQAWRELRERWDAK